MMGAPAVDFARSAELGTRVVIRYLLPDGMATDALGPLVARSDSHCTVDGVRGEVTIAFAAIVAAKPVPPPPVSRRAEPPRH